MKEGKFLPKWRNTALREKTERKGGTEMEKGFGNWRMTLSLIAVLIFSTVFIGMPSTSETALQKSLPPSVARYATDEIYQNISSLKSPPPLPIFEEPPQIIYFNESLTELISQADGNQTLYKNILANFKVNANSTVIQENPVEYEWAGSASTEGIVTPMSYETIDSDAKSGKKLRISIGLYKDTGEIDPNYDYYAVKATLENIYSRGDFWKGILFADIQLFFPDWCDEIPTNHKPEAGFRWGEGVGSFSYKGISLNVKLPAYWISYSRDKKDGWLRIRWTYSGSTGIGPVALWAYWVFSDYTEAAVGIRVPAGKKPYCYMYGWAAWYSHWIFVCSLDSKEAVYWCYVDPPGAEAKPLTVEPQEVETPSNITIRNPKAGTSIDGFIFTVAYTDNTYQTVKYMCISGFGENFYGWHASEYSLVYFFAYVAENGNPLSNVAVNFYLVDPNYSVFYLGSYSTDENGIAQCAVIFDPSLTGGLWWFIPTYGNLQDQCAFSYQYCLVITGYTYMSCWNTIVIEDALLVPENAIIALTANPPSGYTFKYWWINFYYTYTDNPIYLLIDFDCVALARFDPSYTGNGGDLYYRRGGPGRLAYVW